jgi:hypothetical protein
MVGRTLRSRIHYTSHMQRDEYQTIRQVRIMSIVGIWCSNGVLLTKNISPASDKRKACKTRNLNHEVSQWWLFRYKIFFLLCKTPHSAHLSSWLLGQNHGSQKTPRCFLRNSHLQPSTFAMPYKRSHFPLKFFHISPNILLSIDASHRLLLQANSPIKPQDDETKRNERST